MRESRVLVFIFLMALTTFVAGPRLRSSVLREFLSGDCRSVQGCQAVYSFVTPPLEHLPR